MYISLQIIGIGYNKLMELALKININKFPEINLKALEIVINE